MNSLEIGMIIVVIMGIAFIALVKYQDIQKKDDHGKHTSSD